jgi:hypothetical protein
MLIFHLLIASIAQSTYGWILRLKDLVKEVTHFQDDIYCKIAEIIVQL